MEEKKVAIDLGDNVGRILEELAKKLGTTVEEIYPIYIKQAFWEGWIAVVGFLFWSVGTYYGINLGLEVLGHATETRASDWTYLYGVSLLFLGLGGLVGVFMLVMSAGDALTKIINSKYHAIHQIIRDIGRLTGD